MTAPVVETVESDGTMVLVYRYGAPPVGGKQRIQVPDEVMRQFRLAHELRNTLVELALRRDERLTEVWSSYPQVAAAEAELATAEATAEAAAEAVAKARSAQRTTKPTGGTVEALRDARARVREARAARKAARDAIKLDARSRVAEVNATHRAEVKALYSDFVQTRALYWATYNDCVNKSRIADQRVLEARKAGRAAQRRFRRWTGSGSIAVQIQRGGGKPRRSPELLASGDGPYRNVMQVEPWTPPEAWAQLSRNEQRAQARGHAVVAIGSGMRFRLPIRVNRPMPPDADVTDARLVMTQVAGNRRLSVHLTVKIPAPKPRTTGPTFAIHLGWRRDLPGEGSLRVATWRSDTPVTVPAHLLDVVDQVSATTGYIRLPEALIAQINRPDRIHGQRDLLLNPIRELLVDFLTAHPLPEEDARAVTANRVRLWRSPAQFAALALAWGEDPPPGGTQIAQELEAWRRHDKRLWEQEAHGREKAIGRRRDAYRRIAAWITMTEKASRVVVDDADLAVLARKASLTEAPDVPNQAAERAAAQRVDAAPGDLRAALIAAARREGCAIATVPRLGLGRTHECGFVNEPDPGRYATAAVVQCQGCGVAYDQDMAAAHSMLSAGRLLVLEN